jgi:Helicase HerA, central domain
LRPLGETERDGPRVCDDRAVREIEALGLFYLGRVFDAERGVRTEEPFLVDARDLTTHAVIVGMTGSGKTGLGIALLEEAALDGIPALAIDPKGDLGNLALAFPQLRAEDFEPWIDPGEAQREGRSAAEQAAAVAERWRAGLADWGEDGARVGRFAEAADVAIYTPGSRAGTPLSPLRSFAAPPPALAADPEAVRERAQSAVSGLLALVGRDADPLRSREHILLARLLGEAWERGADLDLPGLMQGLQHPPFERMGALELESFYPARERFELAAALNNLLASPAFEPWLEGEPLDVGRLLYRPDGRPRLAVLSIAHLGDAERMFFVTLLLGEVVAWMRAQPGTQTLRALLYMDEVFGYLPPTANPPSKTPLLTLLKQARAYGVGVVLATQNPVDLDYKALSNAGTWFLGRLQTERDRARVVEGLMSTGAGARGDRARLERLLGGLGSRVFVARSAQEDEPTPFQTRFALSYLRGPLTREDLRRLAATRGGPPAGPVPPDAPRAAP